MDWGKREACKSTAKGVARELMDQLKSGALKKIGIDEIRAALAELPVDEDCGDYLEEETTRQVVMSVG